MNIRNIFFLMAVLVAGVYFTGCTEEDGPSVTGPSGVQVTSVDGTSIGVRWTRESGDVAANTIVATPVGGGAAVTETVAAASSGVIDGLSLNQKYVITVQSSTNNSSAGVEWATAIRSGVITLYETAAPASVGPSGLVLSNTPHAAALTGPGNEADRVDLVLATTPAADPLPNLSLQAPDVTGSGLPASTRKTRFGNSYYKVLGGLNADYYTGSFAGDIGSVAAGVNYFADFPNTTGPIMPIGDTSAVILARTIDGNHARIEIQAQPNNLWHKDVVVGGNSYRAIDVIVSYQPMVDVGYASRPIDFTPRSNTPKVGGARAVVKH